MSYTPGHDTARFLNRTTPCGCCNGKGSYDALYGMTELRRYSCEACDGSGRVHVITRPLPASEECAPRHENGWTA